MKVKVGTRSVFCSRVVRDASADRRRAATRRTPSPTSERTGSASRLPSPPRRLRVQVHRAPDDDRRHLGRALAAQPHRSLRWAVAGAGTWWAGVRAATVRHGLRFHGGPAGSRLRGRGAGRWSPPAGRSRRPPSCRWARGPRSPGLTPDDLPALGTPVVLLANTYHLLLRPGPELFRRVGGIHAFMRWPGPVLTDSGGYQIFSLPGDRTVDDAGARFASYIDGRIHHLTPEGSIDMQTAIGVGHHDGAGRVPALDRRRGGAASGDGAHPPLGPAQPGRPQRPGAGAVRHRAGRPGAGAAPAIGGVPDRSIPFDGFAIGGLAVGDTRGQREEMTAFACELLPAERPRYLMGVGTPPDLLHAIGCGVDMFDCVLPTHLAWQGTAFTSTGRVRISRGRPPVRRWAPGRPLRLPHLPGLQPGLPAPPGQVQRTAGAAAAEHPQPAPLPAADARRPRRHRGRRLRRVCPHAVGQRSIGTNTRPGPGRARGRREPRAGPHPRRGTGGPLPGGGRGDASRGGRPPRGRAAVRAPVPPGGPADAAPPAAWCCSTWAWARDRMRPRPGRPRGRRRPAPPAWSSSASSAIWARWSWRSTRPAGVRPGGRGRPGGAGAAATGPAPDRAHQLAPGAGGPAPAPAPAIPRRGHRVLGPVLPAREPRAVDRGRVPAAARRWPADRCTLFTYSASTATRVALLLAGWAVGVGAAIGDKRQTTAAAVRAEDLRTTAGSQLAGAAATPGRTPALRRPGRCRRHGRPGESVRTVSG